MSQHIKDLKDKVTQWWNNDVIALSEPSPAVRIAKASLELAATFGIIYFLEHGDKHFQRLPGATTKKGIF